LRPLCLCGSLFFLACAAPKPPPTPRATAVLVVRCAVADATLWIDDRPVGDVGRIPGGVRLAPGEHRVELRHDRYHTRYAEVSLGDGERRLLELTLPEVLP
jgi:hypothetical protein